MCCTEGKREGVPKVVGRAGQDSYLLWGLRSIDCNSTMTSDYIQNS